MADDKRHVGAQATRNAVQALIERFRQDYDQILGDEREKLGLPRTPQVQKKKSRLEVARDQLRAAGITPDF